MEEKEKEILNIRKVFFLFQGKVEWRIERVEKGIQESGGVFTLMAFW